MLKTIDHSFLICFAFVADCLGVIKVMAWRSSRSMKKASLLADVLVELHSGLQFWWLNMVGCVENLKESSVKQFQLKLGLNFWKSCQVTITIWEIRAEFAIHNILCSLELESVSRWHFPHAISLLQILDEDRRLVHLNYFNIWTYKMMLVFGKTYTLKC